jgi:putative Mg2+ transporter-C (MgtC) family protein
MLGVELLARVGLATVLGIAIGMERHWRSRMAGLQTMALVSMGSALFIVLGAYTFDNIAVDPTRVAAQIAQGIGFLGAGVIMKQGASISGLNTAATLWATAAVGALAGAWMWREAIAGTLLIIAGNVFLNPLEVRMDSLGSRKGRPGPPTDYLFEVVCTTSAEARIQGMLTDTFTQALFQLRSLQSALMPSGEEVRLHAELSTAVQDDAVLETAVGTLSAEPDVRSARWTTLNEAAAKWGG